MEPPPGQLFWHGVGRRMGIDMDMGMVMGKRKAGRGEVGKTRREKLLENSLVFFFFFPLFEGSFYGIAGWCGNYLAWAYICSFCFPPAAGR